MRITLVSPEYPPMKAMGGIGTNMWTLSGGLAEAGHDVSVVTRGDVDDRYSDDGVTVIRLRHRWLPNQHMRRLLARLRIASTVRRLNPDVVHTAEWEAEAWWIARFGHVPIVTHLATPTYLIEELNEGGLNPENAFIRWLERDLTRRSRAIYAPASEMGDRVAKDWNLDRGKIHIIPNPIDVGAVRRMGKADISPPLPSRFIVFLGRLEKRKGIETIGSALPRVLNEFDDLHAVLIGRDTRDENGALMDRFQRQIAPVAPRVHLLGELPRSEALAIVARATIALVPSLWENFGYVCVEAMALGVPVVASAAGGLRDIIKHEENGWLIPPDDSESLAELLIAKLKDPQECVRVGIEARRRAEDFDTSKIINDVVNLFEQAIRSRAGGHGARNSRNRP